MKRLATLVTFILIAHLLSSKARQYPEQKINDPFTADRLKAFKQFSDSIIRAALNKKDISYHLTIDTFKGAAAKNVQYDYFDSDSLTQVIRFGFSLGSPNTRYSFVLLSYEYTSSQLALTTLEKVSTIEHTSYFGLNKEPAYIFRINNFLFWLNAPHSLSGKTFNALQSSLSNQLKQYKIDELTNHVKFSKATGFNQEGLTGKWKLKLVSATLEDDTSKKATYENNIIEIEDSLLRLDGIDYPIAQINKLQLPDVQTFFLYDNGMMWRDKLILNSKLRPFKGSVIRYTIYFKPSVLMMDKKYEHVLLKEFPLRSFVKLSGNGFGFIKDDAYYKMVKVD